MNMVEATLSRSNGAMAAKVGDQDITLDESSLSNRGALRNYDGRTVILGIRPEDLEDATLGDSSDGRRLRGTVELTEALGSELMVHFVVNAKPALTEDVRELAQDAGADLQLEQADAQEGKTTMVGRFGARSRLKQGEATEVEVDTRALHFFDPETGLGIYDQDSTKGVA
jgi:multiple sugar transport system ATP-binding protein